METSTSKISKPANRMADCPTISFSHLATCFYEAEAGDDNSGIAYGFPSSGEEKLHETGTLVKDFLKF